MSKQLTREEIEKELQETADDFNADAVKLVEIEQKLSTIKDNSLTVYKEIFRQQKKKGSSAKIAELEKKLEEIESAAQDEESNHYELLQACYKKLHKVRQVQVSYWNGVANGLQQENDRLQKELEKYTSSPEKSKLETIRENNLE